MGSFSRSLALGFATRVLHVACSEALEKLSRPSFLPGVLNFYSFGATPASAAAVKCFFSMIFKFIPYLCLALKQKFVENLRAVVRVRVTTCFLNKAHGDLRDLTLLSFALCTCFRLEIPVG